MPNIIKKIIITLILAYSVDTYPYFPVCSSVNSNSLVVNTLNGKVKGACYNVTVNYASKQPTTTPVLSFLSIPYAQPPIGSLRFKSPEPVISWNSTLDGTKLPNRCYQVYGGDQINGKNMLNESEDCLLLNVFVPYDVYYNAVVLKNDSYKVPLYVFIHGGAFVSGSGLEDWYEPSTLVAMSNIIVININYRLDVFGFFYLKNTAANGNQGILDQNLALKWIFENAKNFGGDNSKITIGGESAGGHSVGFHLVYKPSWPYFNNAIIQSGTLLSRKSKLISTTEATIQSTNISSTANCTKSTNEEILQCLKSVDPVTLSKIARNVLRYPLIVFDEVIIKKQPSESFASGEFKNANLLIGSNTKEDVFSFVIARLNITVLENMLIGNIKSFKKILLEQYQRFPISEYKPNLNLSDFIELIIKQYLTDDMLNNKLTNFLDYVIQIGTDSQFKYPSIQLANYVSQINSNVFVYSYAYHISSSLLAPKYEAVHFDEIPMVKKNRFYLFI